jgi:dTDP-4-amino-4,6-dideoxygalactose transaminase
MYGERLAGLAVELPVEHGHGRHVFHQYTIQSERRDAVRQALSEAGSASAIFYALPLHRQPAYAGAHRDASLPVAERLSTRVLSLPIHPFLDEQAIDRVTAAVRAAL